MQGSGPGNRTRSEPTLSGGGEPSPCRAQVMGLRVVAVSALRRLQEITSSGTGPSGCPIGELSQGPVTCSVKPAPGAVRNEVLLGRGYLRHEDVPDTDCRMSNGHVRSDRRRIAGKHLDRQEADPDEVESGVGPSSRRSDLRWGGEPSPPEANVTLVRPGSSHADRSRTSWRHRGRTPDSPWVRRRARSPWR